MATKTTYGTESTVNGNPAIRFERKFNHTAEKIWKAITNSGQLSRWFPADLKGEKKVGGTIEIVSFTDRFPRVKGEFTEFSPHHLLEYTWGDETLRWEIKQESIGCLLIFTNILDEKAEKIGKAEIASAWHSCLDVLEFILADQTAPYTTDERFVQVHSEYQKLMNTNVD